MGFLWFKRYATTYSAQLGRLVIDINLPSFWRTSGFGRIWWAGPDYD